MSNALDYLQELRVGPMGAWLLVGYVVFIGGALGSFLNVVAYRLPLGMSLNRPGSRCPHCKHPIRWYHNVPVVGWLVLHGRCYDCGAPIAGRYALVEFLVALASGLIGWTAIRATVVDGNLVYTINLLALGLRLSLVYLLFCVALLEFDANRLPLKLCVCSLAFALLGMWLVPGLRPSQHLAEPDVSTLTEMAFPLLSALLLGLLLWPLFFSPPSATLSDAAARAVALLIVGLVLGGVAVQFAAVLAGGMMVALIGFAPFWPPAQRLGWAISLLIATLLWMLAARSLIGSHDLIVWGETMIYFDGRWAGLALAGVVVVVECLTGRTILAVRKRSLRSVTNEN